MSRKRPAPRTGVASQPLLWAGTADELAGSVGPSCPVQPERDVRVKRAQRGQITWGRVDLDAEVPADHAVRAIAAVVDKLDLRGRCARSRPGPAYTHFIPPVASDEDLPGASQPTRGRRPIDVAPTAPLAVPLRRSEPCPCSESVRGIDHPE